MIYDIITIALIVIFLIVGIRRGAARTLVGIVANIVGYTVSVYLAKLTAAYIYSSMIENTIIQSVSDSVTTISDNAMDTLFGSVPEFFRQLFGTTGDDMHAALSDTVGDLSSAAAATVETAVKPTVMGILSFLLTLLFFVLVMFLLRRFAIRPILKLFKLPVLSGINRFFGGVLGVVEGLVIVSIIAFLLHLVLPYISSASGIFNESTIYNSYIFYHFYSGNIFTALTSLISF